MDLFKSGWIWCHCSSIDPKLMEVVQYDISEKREVLGESFLRESITNEERETILLWGDGSIEPFVRNKWEGQG